MLFLFLLLLCLASKHGEKTTHHLYPLLHLIEKFLLFFLHKSLLILGFSSKNLIFREVVLTIFSTHSLAESLLIKDALVLLTISLRFSNFFFKIFKLLISIDQILRELISINYLYINWFRILGCRQKFH